MRGTVCGIVCCWVVASACQAQTLGRPTRAEEPAVPGTVVGKSLPANPSSTPQISATQQTDFAEIGPVQPTTPKTGELPKIPVVPNPNLGLVPSAPIVPPLPVPTTQNGMAGTLPTPVETPIDQGEKAKADDFTPKFKFKPGDEHLLQMETANGLFKFFVGGRLQIDGAWMRTNDAVQAPREKGGIGKADDAANFRRARFDFGGTFYKNIDFLMEFDFINTVNAERSGAPLPVNTPVPTDLWVTFKDIPFAGNIRVGNMKPPISFEHLTSSRFLNFMERSLAFDAFIENQNNGFEPGIMAFDTAMEERATWALGVFKNTRSIFGWNVGDGEYDVTARVTALPIYENDGEFLVHVGIAASHRDLDDDQERMRARLMVRDGPAILHNIVAEARLLGDSRDTVAPEFVVVWGPWTFQSEYYRAWVNNAAAPVDSKTPRNYGTLQFQGGYAEILYFLTGEHRHYDKKRAAFGRVTPNQNYRGFGMSEEETESGIGAWQIGVRYSFLDLDNKGFRGSTCQDITVGLNWFLNPYMKWQFNYTQLFRDAPDSKNSGWVSGLGTRLAFDF